jgi:uncharacterized protein YcbK (DUF882 family)
MSDWRYFTREEFSCRETGENRINADFVDGLDDLREACGFPFTITSGYRSPLHSKERDKPGGPGQHSAGVAADIAVGGGVQRWAIVEHAIALGFSGIGVAKTFVHVDMRSGQSVMWTY